MLGDVRRARRPRVRLRRRAVVGRARGRRRPRRRPRPVARQLRHAAALMPRAPARVRRSCARAANAVRSPTRRSTSCSATTARCRSAIPTARCPRWRRVLRPGGRSRSRTRRRCRTSPGTPTATGRRAGSARRTSACGASTRGEGTVDFQLPYGEWIRLFRRHGLASRTSSSCGRPESATTTYDDFAAGAGRAAGRPSRSGDSGRE